MSIDRIVLVSILSHVAMLLLHFIAYFSFLQSSIGDKISFDPEWSSIEPKRTIRFASDANADSVVNGDRLRKAIDSLLPGDLLEIGGGTYSVNRYWDLSISGIADAPIWIVSALDSRVVITRPDPKQNIINVGLEKPVQYVIFRGLEFTGGSHGIRLGKCNNVWIDRCHVHHTGDVCLSANSADTHHLFITRNVIHDGGGTAEGMYLGGNRAEVVMRESVIARNHVYECRGSQGDGIEIKHGSWGNLIAENTVHDCNYPCITVYGTNGKQQNIIECNVCFRSRDSVLQIQGEAVVRNNLAIDGKNAAFASTDHQGKTTNLQVIHNTFVSKSHAFRGGSWNERENMVLANNVIYSRDQNALHFANGSENVTIAGNVVLGEGAKYGSAIGRGLVDFRNVTWDANVIDATPTVDAPFDQGVDAYRATVDLNGKTRPANSITCGAFLR